MASVTIVVDGVPKAQPRVKACIRGSHAATYDPKTANDWKAIVALASRPHRPASPLAGPVLLHIAFYLPRPKRLCRKRDPSGPVWCTSKPDFDNLAKAVADVCTNEGWWRDDSQVVDSRTTKHYHAIGGRPGARITIEELQPAEEPAIESGDRGACLPRTGRATRRAGTEAEDLGPATILQGRGLGASPRRRTE